MYRGVKRSGQYMDRFSLGSAFGLLWLSETLFDLGSALMGFALGVWIFQRTGSAEQFFGAVVAATLPGLLVTPLTAALADRFDRRWVIAGCDIASVLMIGLLAGLLYCDHLAVRHLYFFNAGMAIVVSIRAPAYTAALSAIVPGDRLTQVSALVGTTRSILQIGSPLLAGYLMGTIGLAGVVVVEVVMSMAGAVVAFGALSQATHAIRGVIACGKVRIFKAMVSSFSFVLRYLKCVPLMAGLAAYGVLQNSLLVLAGALLTPLVLSTHSSSELGTILTSGATGSLAGSVLSFFAPVTRRLMLWTLLYYAGLSACVTLAGFVTSLVPWCLCAFLAFLCGSASGVCAQALWLRKTPVARRGSILALLNAINLLTMCVVMLLGGGLSEHVFEPALATGGAWADTIGVWVGTGKGRGLGFMFIVSGATGLLISLLALTHTRLRRLDELVPDQPNETLCERLGAKEVVTLRQAHQYFSEHQG